MLVITRKLGERVLIGPDIEVMILEIDRNKCRIGITAPKDVRIWREEIRPEPATEATP